MCPLHLIRIGGILSIVSVQRVGFHGLGGYGSRNGKAVMPISYDETAVPCLLGKREVDFEK
jgi:hypothetical protein